MENRDRLVWLITGANRGLGLSFVQEALKRGHKAAACARRPETIPDITGDLLPVRIDVTDIASIEEGVASALDRFGRIDVAVNNAGYGIFGALEETTDEETRRIFDTNVFGTMNVIRAVLPTMRSQGFGRIVNMGSMASFSADPGGALYDSTKFAIAGLSEVLSLELGCFGIQSMVVEPGMLRTDFFDASSMRQPARLMGEYDGTPGHAALEYCLSHNRLQYGSPRKAAAVVCDIVESGDMPPWLPLGEDAVKKFERKLGKMVESIQPYRERCVSIAFDAEER